MSDTAEDYGGLPRALLELRCGMLAADNRELTQHYRATAQKVKDHEHLVSRYIAASEAAMEPDSDARVLPVPAAGGSRGSMRDRGPGLLVGMERSTRRPPSLRPPTRGDRSRTTTPLEYVEHDLSPTGSMC